MSQFLGVMNTLSGFDILWGSLTGAYLVKGLNQTAFGSGVNRDFDREKGYFRFKKRKICLARAIIISRSLVPLPVRRLLLGVGLNTVVVLVAYNSYCFGISDYGWVQSILDRFSVTGRVDTDQLSVLLSTSLLLTHTVLRLYRSLYINVFCDTTQGLLDFISPYLYTLMGGFTILSEAPALNGSGFNWFDWSLFSWRHLAGVALFVWASIQDNKLQYQLAKLRKNRAGHVVSIQHKLPSGGWFDRVSSPHFLMEILINIGIGLTLGFSHHSWWLCVCYVSISQIVRALAQQQWYKKKFENFPEGKSSIIPYLL